MRVRVGGGFCRPFPIHGYGGRFLWGRGTQSAPCLFIHKMGIWVSKKPGDRPTWQPAGVTREKKKKKKPRKSSSRLFIYGVSYSRLSFIVHSFYFSPCHGLARGFFFVCDTILRGRTLYICKIDIEFFHEINWVDRISLMYKDNQVSPPAVREDSHGRNLMVREYSESTMGD